MRYSLEMLLLAGAIVPPILAGVWFLLVTLDPLELLGWLCAILPVVAIIIGVVILDRFSRSKAG